MQLIKMGAAQAKRMFPVLGNIDVIDTSPYNLEIDGYVVIVEFEEQLSSIKRDLNNLPKSIKSNDILRAPKGW